MDELVIYWTAFKASLLARFEYRGDFFISTIGGICFQIAPLLAYGILKSHVTALGGWKTQEILFLFGLWGICLGLSELFIDNIWNFSEQVLDGSLDRLLVYPVRQLPFYLVCSPSIHAFANIGIGTAMLIYCGQAVHFSIWVWLCLPYWAICGMLIYGSILVCLGSMAVLAPSRGLDMLWLVAQLNLAARYPLNIYPMFLRTALLVLPPLGAYHYLPGLWLFHGGNAWQGLGAPLLAAALSVFAANLCWGAALNGYKSTGS